MGASISGLLILAVFFTAILVMFRTTLLSDVLISDANKEATNLSGERARTAFDITTTTGDGSCTLTVTGDNTGTTSIADFSFMDVIVQYSSGTNSPERLTFTTASAPASTGEWAEVAVSGNFEPNILNPGETLTIKAMLTLKTSDSTGTVTVGTPNGVTDTNTFPQVVPC